MTKLLFADNFRKYRTKDKNKVSFMLRYNKRSGYKYCL